MRDTADSSSVPGAGRPPDDVACLTGQTPGSGDEPWGWRDVILPGLAFLLVAALQIWARARVPLAAFGADGAELIPHLQRQYALYYQAHQGLSMWLHPWHTLRALDGQYPGLLHLLAVPWSWLPGEMTGGGFAMAAHLNLPLLALLAWSTAQVMRGALADTHGTRGTSSEAETPDRSPDRGAVQGGGAPAWAGALVLLVPGLFAAARRYYYDLPMTAAILAAAACLLGGRGLADPRRAAGAGLATAAALLLKWAAGLYLVPIWTLGLWVQRRSASRARAWAYGAAALATVAAVCGPVATVPGGSFAFQLRASSSPLKPGHTFWSGLEFYGEALWSAGLGPALTIVVGISSLLALTTAEGRLILRWAAVTSLPPLAYLAAYVPSRDGRYLMPLLPWLVLAAVAGAEALARRVGRGWTVPLLLVAALQVAWVDGSTSAHLAPVADGTPGTTGWRAWWWTGIRQDTPSPAGVYEGFARAALEHAPRGRLLVASADATPIYSKAWQYHLDALRPGGASLAAPPTASSAEAFVDAVALDADVVVAVGTLGRPALLGSWIRWVSGRPVDDAVVARFRAVFPVHQALVAEGLEVHLYARE